MALSLAPHAQHELDLGPVTLAILGGTIISKLLALLYCRSVAARFNSASCEAYAQDHFNDVLTNSVGVAAVTLAWWKPEHLATLDPIGDSLVTR